MSQNHSELEEIGLLIVITQPPVVKTIKGIKTKHLIPSECILLHKFVAKICQCILPLSHVTLKKICRYLLLSIDEFVNRGPCCHWKKHKAEQHGNVLFCASFVIQTYESICFQMKCNVQYWHKITMHSTPKLVSPRFLRKNFSYTHMKITERMKGSNSKGQDILDKPAKFPKFACKQ